MRDANGIDAKEFVLSLYPKAECIEGWSCWHITSHVRLKYSTLKWEVRNSEESAWVAAANSIEESPFRAAEWAKLTDSQRRDDWQWWDRIKPRVRMWQDIDAPPYRNPLLRQNAPWWDEWNANYKEGDLKCPSTNPQSAPQ
jgi:hypothetical protein